MASETKLPDGQWQTTFGGFQQKLSVRHKMIGVSRNYKAEFIVYNQETKETYFADILVKTDDWGRVFFPDDFRKRDGSTIYGLDGGEFIWNCIVEGDVVVDGMFSISTSLFDSMDLRKIIEE